MAQSQHRDDFIARSRQGNSGEAAGATGDDEKVREYARHRHYILA
jgi:hypothetical protein